MIAHLFLLSLSGCFMMVNYIIICLLDCSVHDDQLIACRIAVLRLKLKLKIYCY